MKPTTALRLVQRLVIWSFPGLLLSLGWLAQCQANDEASSSLREIRLQHSHVFGESPVTIALRGADARWQMLVEAIPLEGEPHDVTQQTTYSVEPPSIASVNAQGIVTPMANGVARLQASFQGHLSECRIEVTGFDEQPLVNFPNQVVPIFTKLGCNGGGCHGKAAGQNGFRLSLLGFEPKEDFEHLVVEARGRRLSPISPDQSLLLTKSLNVSPHGGGQRMEKNSYEYRMIRRWIAQAMPYGSDQDARVVRIEVLPESRRMSRESQQQLAVLAHLSDGSIQDITQTAQYEANQTDMAEVSSTGLVTTRDLGGDVAIMTRYQGQVAVFRASIPLGGQAVARPVRRNTLDDAVFDKLESLGVPAAAVCDDATFVRRVTIDIAGRLPTNEELQSFLSSTAPEKRRELVNRLLETPDYANHFAMKWNAILRNQRGNNETRFGAYAFHGWIRESLYDNKPYDQWVRELLTASGSAEENPAVVWLREVPTTESRVEDAAQLFLGQRVQCARCHHHPYEKWSQKDYAQLSAFFTLLEKKEGRSNQESVFVSRFGNPTARHPKSGESLSAAGLGAAPIEASSAQDPRHALADWMVTPSNPFFAKALVNRYWKHFVSKALVEPEDDMRVTNPPSNPQLMEALCQEFVEHKYDLKHLIRTICDSTTYQFASEADALNIRDQNSFARFYPRRLSAEVLLDAIDVVCGTTTSFDGMPPGTTAVALPDTSFASYFLTVFGRPDSSTACECERSQTANLAQSLHLLNSKEIQAKLAHPQGRAAKMASEATDAAGLRKCIEEIYQIAYARPPRDSELQISLAYLESRRGQLAPAFEDLLWAIINSKEFLFQH